jgi:hypothetical protein
LNLAADVADEAVRVIEFGLNRLDPADPMPSGFRLRFSGAINPLLLDDAVVPGTVSRSVVVVDEQGGRHAVRAVGYDESNAELSFLFLDRIPLGHCRVELSGEGGLVDLSGQAPVAPGFGSGVLASFQLASRAAESRPNDLGTLIPGTTSEHLSRTVELSGNRTVVLRVGIAQDGFYVTDLEVEGGAVDISLVGPGGIQAVATARSDGSMELNDLHRLTAGIYRLVLKLEQGARAKVTIGLRPALSLPDSPVLSGVGNGPALNLRLIQPSLTAAAMPPSYQAGAGASQPNGEFLTERERESAVQANFDLAETPVLALAENAVGRFSAPGVLGGGADRDVLLAMASQSSGRPLGFGQGVTSSSRLAEAGGNAGTDPLLVPVPREAVDLEERPVRPLGDQAADLSLAGLNLGAGIRDMLAALRSGERLEVPTADMEALASLVDEAGLLVEESEAESIDFQALAWPLLAGVATAWVLGRKVKRSREENHRLRLVSRSSTRLVPKPKSLSRPPYWAGRGQDMAARRSVSV